MRALPLSARFFFSTGARSALTSAAKQPPATTRAAPFRYRVAPLAINRFMSVKPISPEEKQKVNPTQPSPNAALPTGETALLWWSVNARS
jgi:hypothetical protein